MPKDKCDIGLIGLGVMGRNLVLNIADHGYAVAVFNRTRETTQKFIKELGPGQDVRPAYSYEELADLLETPRAVIVLVPAGKPVDAVLDDLKAVLKKGDLIIDGGNSHYTDTDRRADTISKAGLHFFGMGISGGEKGARYGPSMMPGGPEKAYERVRPILEAAAAQAAGTPCVAHLGTGSAGHYVKMVHNGIEYGLMQILSETYALMKQIAGLSNSELARVYSQWNRGKAESYLVEITADIFQRKDDRTGNDLIDMILDKAQQKGTGKWTSMDAMDLQTPVPTIDEAVTARNMSTFKEERVRAAQVWSGPALAANPPERFIDRMEKAFLASMVITYAQGMSLLKQASDAYHYGLKLDEVAKIWRGGCIIRAALLDDIRTAFQKRPDLRNLLLDDRLGALVRKNMDDLRAIIKAGVDFGISIPALYSTLGYFDSYREKRMPTNLIQAQRDYFGAHTYQRIDAEGSFHTEWEPGQEGK